MAAEALGGRGATMVLARSGNGGSGLAGFHLDLPFEYRYSCVEMLPGRRAVRRLGRGYFQGVIMPQAPAKPRSIAFVDGQNLFNAAKEAFGYTYPNYDVLKLAQEVASMGDWLLIETRFYSGIPERSDPRHAFWGNKLSALGRQGVVLFSRSLRYHQEDVTLPDGSTSKARVPVEKGVDIRLALDLVRLALANRFDVAIIFSQDQDYSEAAKEIRSISKTANRWIKVVSAFPSSQSARNRRGIELTDWIRIDKATYDRCIDPADYRPGRRANEPSRRAPEEPEQP